MSEQDKVTRQLAALTALCRELVEHEAEAFDADEEINGGDLVEWFADFRESVKQALGERDPTLLAVAIGNAFEGMWLRGPFLDHDTADTWAQGACDGDDYHIIEVEADPAPDPAPAE